MADPRGIANRLRQPWYWLALLVFGAAVCSALTVLAGRDRIAQNDRQFASAQMLRLATVKQSIDDLFGDAVQLASSGASIYGRVPNQPTLISSITRDLYVSALNRRLFGAGPFFARGAIGPGNVLSSFYVRRDDRSIPRSANVHPFSGGAEVDYRSAKRGGGDDYTTASWYRKAVAVPGHTVIWGPYLDQGRSYISVLRAFRRDGRIEGVMSVDVLQSDFVRLMRQPLIRDEVASVVDSGDRRVFLSTTSPQAAFGHDRAAVFGLMRFAPHTRLELSTATGRLHRENAGVIAGTAAAVLVIWSIALVMGVGLFQRIRWRERQALLEADRVRLEREVTVSRTVERELRKAAYSDALTGLPNRTAFLERAGDLLRGRRESQAVFFIDLDRFNIVNETLGHLAGDELLRTVGARLRAVLAEGDMISRLGGDEFVVIAQIDKQRSLEECAAMLLAHLGEPIVVQGRSLYPEASIGVVTIDESYASAEDVLRDADIAMYEAKHRGRAQFVIFDAQMRRRVALESELENALRRALERGEILPYYQPVVSTQTGTIVGFEALARWHREGSVISACDFMPFAEQHGLVAAIDVRMLHEVCRHGRAIFDLFPNAKVAVNISASELGAPGLVETIEQLRERHGNSGGRLELEITETTMMTSSDGARRTIERLRDLGVDLVLDDFGTGYSSLAYLQRLPIKGIKIDRSFVQPMLDDARAVEILRSIVLMARSFDLTTTAEGVEDVEQFRYLRQLGIDYAQGFFFSPAVDIASLARLQSQSISERFAVE